MLHTCVIICTYYILHKYILLLDIRSYTQNILHTSGSIDLYNTELYLSNANLQPTTKS